MKRAVIKCNRIKVKYVTLVLDFKECVFVNRIINYLN